jgi:hypothetical protein
MNMDQILGGLFGANDDEDEQTRVNRANDFVSRVKAGNKADGYSTEEAVKNYKSVATQLPDDEFEDVAASALSQLSPEERREFNRVVRDQAGIDLGDGADDPRQLAGLTRQLRAGGGGGLLGGLLGGGGSDDILGSLGGLLGGGSSTTGGVGTGQTSQAGIAGLLGNPIVKMVLGLIAAEAMKRFMGGGGQQTSTARVTPSGSGSDRDSGGGLLDSLFGGGDDNSQAERDRQDNSGGGGLLDALFGGGNDDDKRDARKANDSDVDVSKIRDNDSRKRSI